MKMRTWIYLSFACHTQLIVEVVVALDTAGNGQAYTNSSVARHITHGLNIESRLSRSCHVVLRGRAGKPGTLSFVRGQVTWYYDFLTPATPKNTGALLKHAYHEDKLRAVPSRSKPFSQGHALCRDVPAITSSIVECPLGIRYSIYFL